jgi:hypothetical protein
MTAERSPHQSASLRRLERKVDELGRGVIHLAERVDTLNLNGSAPALLRLAQNSDQLLKLAEVAPRITAAVERDQEWATWWKVTKRTLNPLRPIGAFLWTVIASVAALVIANHLH